MASSGSAVVVLTPNGRRQTIKVSPNTPLLQVLEDVCRKHGFNSEDHGLKFQRSVLDLTLPWRFANLPNNAKLEMVTSTKKQADSQVRIALQMEDGSRLQDSFSSGQSLWELLTHFPQISPSELSASGSTPVCVYMRDEVCGQDELKKATLKSLGLTGGNAIIRFLFKKEKTPKEEEEEEEEVKHLTEIAALPTPPVAKETTTTSSSQPHPSHPETSTTEEQSLSLDASMETSQTPTCATAINKLPVQHDCDPSPQNAVRPKDQAVKLETSVEDGEQAGPSGVNCHPSSSTAPSAPFIPFSGGGQRLGGPGGGRLAPGDSLFSSSSALTPAVESPKAKKAKSSCSSNTKCKDTAVSSDEDFNFGERFAEPVEREPLIYHLDTISHPSGVHGDLPDEFFEVTVDDVRKRFAQLKSERKLLEETPLMTKSSRESKIMEKLNRYPKVVLRVQFPDRQVLQGFFRPLETVDAVRHFVRSHLEDPQLSFYLFITPPKTILDDHTATLFQANLFPGALMYFGSDEKTDFYIKREMLESSVTALQANETIASCILQSSPTCSSADKDKEELMLSSETSSDASASTQDEKPPSATANNAKPVRSDPGKVPKWLKLSGKK